MDLIDQLLAGNRRALARVISCVEDDPRDAQGLLAALYPHSGRAHIIGVTGSPGSGKSTLVNALARAYRALGCTVGIVAVDPTSPFSGGALLGDRVRMRDLAGDPGIFIRSMATRGSLGGLAYATTHAVMALDAAGFERILIETVGVGQAEVDIAREAHTTVVVEAPGLGDEIQAIKAGVLEIADLFAVNKADREGTERTVRALQMMQGLAGAAGHHSAAADGAAVTGPRQQPGAQRDGSWLPPITKTVAALGQGIVELRDWIESHGAYLRAHGGWDHRELSRAGQALEHVLRDELLATLLARLPTGRLDTLAAAVAARLIDPYTASQQLVAEAAVPARELSLLPD